MLAERTRLRSLIWKQWKNPKTRVHNLESLGIAHRDAMLCGNARKKYWHMSKIKWVAIAMPEKYFIVSFRQACMKKILSWGTVGPKP